MSLKRQNNMMSAFSMASMTDVVFLLLIFFMVTSTYVFPTALEVNLPQSTEQTAIKPTIRIYIDAEGGLATVAGTDDPQPMDLAALPTWLQLATARPAEPGAETEAEIPAIALYADESVPYGKIVEILNIGAQLNLKIVLATKPTAAPSVAVPAVDSESGNATVLQ